MKGIQDGFTLRRCRDTDHEAIFEIINEAARAYRGVIPADCWHEPYMSMSDLRREIDSGVVFWGCDINGDLIAVMGIQTVKDVDLIRHAYVRPGHQRGGIGRQLLHHLQEQAQRPMLVGTWADATWAIDFYRRNGFDLVSREETLELLRRYWSISERQAEVSVVLTSN
jgi:GNAT superfamily N-acetyltransferase